LGNASIMPVMLRLATSKALADNDCLSIPASCLGKTLIVNGHLEADGEIQIHGRVRGRIDATRLFLGAEGYVEGDVVADDVHILGELKGRVFAPNVTLDSTA
jgi:cytoskeletal protein CcmA (bactofilin family)